MHPLLALVASAITPAVAAAWLAAALYQLSLLVQAGKNLWSFIPLKWQWVPGQVLVAIGVVEKAYAGQVSSWTDFAFPLLLATMAFAPGAQSAAHRDLVKVADNLANQTQNPSSSHRQIARAHFGERRVRLMGMTLALMFAALALTGCTAKQLDSTLGTIGKTVGEVASLIAEADNDLSLIEQGAAVLLANEPSARSEFGVLDQDARVALDRLGKATDKATWDAALADFRDAYTKLSGLANGLRAASAPPGARLEAFPQPRLVGMRE